MSEERIEAMGKAVKFLAARAHSTAELRRKLAIRDFSPSIIESVIEECVRKKYLDDRMFTEYCLDELKNCRGYGPRKCRAYLIKKGIAPEMIDEVMTDKQDSAEVELEQAMEVLKRRMPSLERESDLLKRKEKAIRFMAGRGFSFDISNRAYEQLSRLDD